MLRIVFIIVLVAVLCFGIAISFFNAEAVRFNYLAGEVQLPLIGLMIAELLLVALITLLLCSLKMLKMAGEARRLKRQIKDQQAELNALRNLPLRETS